MQVHRAGCLGSVAPEGSQARSWAFLCRTTDPSSGGSRLLPPTQTICVKETANTDQKPDIYAALPSLLAYSLSSPSSLALLKNLPEPWEPAEEPTQKRPSEASRYPASVPLGVAAIPTLEHDTLLASTRPAWRRPPTLQLADFERVVRAKGHSFVSMLALIRAGHWKTGTAMARFFGKPSTWANQVMWFCLRAGYVTDTATFRGYFPKRRITASALPLRRRRVMRKGPVEPFSFPPLDSPDDY